MHPIEKRAPKVYNKVCKFIDEIGYSSKISVNLEYVHMFSTVAIIYVNIKNDLLSISNIRHLLSPHFNKYMNTMSNNYKIYILIQKIN